MEVQPHVAIVIVNWNGWQDTVECLESVLRLDYPAYQVIVCDNGSTDGSLERIQAWAAGRVPAPATCNKLSSHTMPPVMKPISCTCLSRSQAEAGVMTDSRLVLIDAKANLGFAGGNNLALRYLRTRGYGSYFWLLNNDTVVEKGALNALICRMVADPAIGMCGSTLLYYHRPDIIQGLGGATYNRWLGTNRHLGVLEPFGELPDPGQVEERMDYVVGASMLVSERFLAEIGLMGEDYFIYFEELDWAMRAKGHFLMGWAPDSIVYHKEGGSAGTTFDLKRKPSQVDYFLTRNKLIVTRRYFSMNLPTVYLGLVVTCFNRIWRGQWARLSIIMAAVKDSWQMSDHPRRYFGA